MTTLKRKISQLKEDDRSAKKQKSLRRISKNVTFMAVKFPRTILVQVEVLFGPSDEATPSSNSYFIWEKVNENRRVTYFMINTYCGLGHLVLPKYLDCAWCGWCVSDTKKIALNTTPPILYIPVCEDEATKCEDFLSIHRGNTLTSLCIKYIVNNHDFLISKNGKIMDHKKNLVSIPKGLYECVVYYKKLLEEYSKRTSENETMQKSYNFIDEKGILPVELISTSELE